MTGSVWASEQRTEARGRSRPGHARLAPAPSVSGAAYGGVPVRVLRGWGMSHREPSSSSLFPHHQLIAYQVALEFVKLVGSVRPRCAASSTSAQERASSALNTAEGAARQSLADKSRA
jgi:hypothetical protein